MTALETPAGYIPIFCANPDCRKIQRVGEPQFIGFATPGSGGGWWCRKCRVYSWVTVPVERPLLEMVAHRAPA
jgi:hypothetical protein